MKKNFLTTTVIATILMMASCRKESEEPKIFTSVPESTIQSKPNKVNVSNVQELYQAVNDANNAGKEIVLAPGVYMLDASYPNGGRLELQTDMSLTGKNGHTSAVLIDQSGLPNSSFRLTPTVSVAPIRLGKGDNSLEWLSVKGGSIAANPLSTIESDLIGTETNVSISNVYVDCNGSRIGILLRNRLDEHANRLISASLQHNEITNAINNVGAGVAFQNRISGAQISVKLKDNYIHGCRIGVLNFNAGLGNTVEHCTLDVESNGDQVENNGCGLDLSAASAPPISNYNTTTAKIHNAKITGNGVTQLAPVNGSFLSGLTTAGAYGSNSASNNSFTLLLSNCDISNNNGTDIYAYGAYSPSNELTGINNHNYLFLQGKSALTSVVSAASVPVEPAGTNTVSIVRN